MNETGEIGSIYETDGKSHGLQQGIFREDDSQETNHYGRHLSCNPLPRKYICDETHDMVNILLKSVKSIDRLILQFWNVDSTTHFDRQYI
jgi:hypothetical protein